MSVVAARQKRTALHLSVLGLLIMVVALSTVSMRDPSGLVLRISMTLLASGAAVLIPWRALAPVTLAIWLGPNYMFTLIEEGVLFDANMLLELPCLLGVAAFAGLTRYTLESLEAENILIGATSEAASGIDPDTGVYEERLLRPALEAELVRARRFERKFALVLVGIDEISQRFDYRDPASWKSSFVATAQVLRSTRAHIDRVYLLGNENFALILPESGESEVLGLVRRLRRATRVSKAEAGEPGGPLPIHFGATFFPHCATSADDLMRRGLVAMRLAEKNVNRVQLDGAAAPEMEPPQSLRHAEERAGLDEEPQAAPTPLHQLEAPRPGVLEQSAAASVVQLRQTPIHSVEPAAGERVEEALALKEPLQESLDDVVKRMDETLRMLRSLRTGPAA